MPTYSVGIYNFDPYYMFSRTVGNSITYTGPANSTGTATIFDNATGLTLEDDNRGETATGNVTINGNTSTGAGIDAEESWTVLNVTTGETFQLVTFHVSGGGANGYYTLSEKPLVPGNVYRTLAYDNSPDFEAGDPVFTYADYVSDIPDGTIDGTSGDDVIDHTYAGDPQNEVVDGGDSISNPPVDLFLDWSARGADESSIAGGFTADTGGINVSYSFNNLSGTGSATVESTSTQYVGTGEPYDNTSSLELRSTGGSGDVSVSTIDFSAVGGSGYKDEVVNLSFRINDIDTGTWQDRVEVRAFDADGNQITVNITISGNETQSGGVVTAGAGNDDPADAAGSVLFSIDGPVSYIEIHYGNLSTGGQAIYVTDLHFQAVQAGGDADVINAGAGNDSIDSGVDNDTVYGGTGNDTIAASEDDDTLYGGDGADRFVMGDGMGSDSIVGGEGGTDADVIDASAVTSGVTVTFSGTEAGSITDGADTSTFSEIEQFILTGQADTVDGTASSGPMTIYAGAGADSITGGSGADVIFGGIGNDQIAVGLGDSAYGGADADTFTFSTATGSGPVTIAGGETGTDADHIDASGVPVGITVTFTGNEAGTITALTETAVFSEIEQFTLTSQADTLDGSASTAAMTIAAGAGNDSVVGGDGADIIDLGSGADTVQVGEGDSVSGGDGDDTFTIIDTAGTGTITITGGEGGETSGDTLNFNGLLNKGSKVITNADDLSGGLTGYAFLTDGTRVEFSQIENIICFARGTGIMTSTGEKKIEKLGVGDQVLTLDHGLQTVRWIGSRKVPAQGSLAPVVIGAGVLGNDRDLVVSPQHRLLIEGPRAELLFGVSGVLVAAKHLLTWDGVWRRDGGEVEYLHMLFDTHQIVHANGALAESFHPGEQGLDAVTDDARAEIFTLFPELEHAPHSYGPAARAALRGYEAELLGAQMA